MRSIATFPTFLFMFILILILQRSAEAEPTHKKSMVVEGLPAERFKRGNKWAVVVGVNDYSDGRVPDLKYCVADAQLVARTLVGHCGYPEENVLLMTDDQSKAHLRPNRVALLQQVAAWLKFAKKGDTVFLYFSGHGFLDDSGQGFLASQNTEIDNLGLTALRTDDLRNMLRQCKATQKMLVLDCCHAGAERNLERATSSQEIGHLFRDTRGLITLASCGKKEKSRESDDLEQGLFTYYLARGLRGNADRDRDGLVTSDELYRYTHSNVSRAARRLYGASQQPRNIRGEDVVGVFTLARLEPKLQPIVESRVKASFTVRTERDATRQVSGATVRLLHRRVGAKDSNVLGEGVTDASGRVTVTASILPYMIDEGEFFVAATSGGATKRYALPKFPETKRYVLTMDDLGVSPPESDAARGWIGVKTQDLGQDVARSRGLSPYGVFVVAVAERGPGDKAGLRTGDVVVELNDEVLQGENDLRNQVSQLTPGSKTELIVFRDGQRLELTMTIGQLEKSTNEPPLKWKQDQRLTDDLWHANASPEGNFHPRARQESRPAGKVVTNSLGMQLAYIPPGRFVMGSPKNERDRRDDEKQHPVTLTRGFYLGVFEVTQAEFQVVLGRNPSYFSVTGGGKEAVRGHDTEPFPVENVSWYDCIEFCNELSRRERLSAYYKLEDVKRDTDRSITSATVFIAGGDGYRLPTEAEWEYACRAGTTTPFHFGHTLNGTQANVNGDHPYGTIVRGPSLGRTTAVGSYADYANNFGLHDMHGNVCEWCFDTGADDPASLEEMDPVGHNYSTGRIVRGGDFTWPNLARAAQRICRGSGWQSSALGFRIGRTPE